jgi:RNA polymerase sigma-32 factor
VAHALTGLSDREQLIIRERMMSDEPATLQRLGDMLGVSKERVRQLEERARGKLRSELESLREDAVALGVA